jgi:fructokinase
MLNKLGHRTAFLGKVGNDIFGRQLRAAVESAGIDVSGLLTDEDVRTTLAFVETKPDGDRDFSFYRNPGADMMLREDEVRHDIIADAKIFHFGTLSMTHEGVRNATKKALRAAKEAGAVISFDPNLREPLWNSLDEAKEQVLYGLGLCDILKISDNEIQWLTGEEDFTKGVHWILERYHIPLILVSMGREGSRAYYKDLIVEVKPFIQKNTIETTGAGDTFCACVLHYILGMDLPILQRMA